MKCNQENCEADATHRIMWPGRGWLTMCKRHVEKGEQILRVLGSATAVEPIDATANPQSELTDRPMTPEPPSAPEAVNATDILGRPLNAADLLERAGWWIQVEGRGCTPRQDMAEKLLTAAKALRAGTAPTPAGSACPVRPALQEALEMVELYHGAPGWLEYQQSPEMKRIRAALAAPCPGHGSDLSALVGQKRPKIVCLCGSSRFVAEMACIAWALERDEGAIVLALHLLPADYPGLRPDHQAEAEKVAAHMDELHLRKIDLADVVMVVNIGGYIGDSTRREIAYARAHGKPVRYLEPPVEVLLHQIEGKP